jgi:hypothetical protein
MTSDIEAGQTRKRILTSKLLDSDEHLAKKLRAKATTGPSNASKMTPSVTSRSSCPDSTMSSASINDDDDDAEMESQGPAPRRKDRILVISDGSSDDENDAKKDLEPSQLKDPQEGLGM